VATARGSHVPDLTAWTAPAGDRVLGGPDDEHLMQRSACVAGAPSRRRARRDDAERVPNGFGLDEVCDAPCVTQRV